MHHQPSSHLTLASSCLPTPSPPRLAAGLVSRQRQRAAGQLPRVAPRLPPHGRLTAGQVRTHCRCCRVEVDLALCCGAMAASNAAQRGSLGSRGQTPLTGGQQHAPALCGCPNSPALTAFNLRSPPPHLPSCRSSAPIPKFQHPSHSLLEENGFTQMKYEKFYARCIQVRRWQRSAGAAQGGAAQGGRAVCFAELSGGRGLWAGCT